jgi:hypothetical protein
VRFPPPLAVGCSPSTSSGIAPADFEIVIVDIMVRHHDEQQHPIFKLEFKRRPVNLSA